MIEKSEWLTAREFSRLIGRSHSWICRGAATGYFHDFGIGVFVINHGSHNRKWFFRVPSSIL